MKTGIILETERLYLRVLDKADADKALEYSLRNADFLSEWEPLKNKEFYTLSHHQAQIKNDLRLMSESSMFKVWIQEKGEPNLIGLISLSSIVRGAFQSCFLGYKLDKDKINRGYMTEALKKVIEYAFEKLDLHRIEANIMPHNLRSLRVVEKLGFYHEGLARKYLKIHGKWEDHIHMVLRNTKME